MRKHEAVVLADSAIIEVLECEGEQAWEDYKADPGKTVREALQADPEPRPERGVSWTGSQSIVLSITAASWRIWLRPSAVHDCVETIDQSTQMVNRATELVTERKITVDENNATILAALDAVYVLSVCDFEPLGGGKVWLEHYREQRARYVNENGIQY